MARSDPEETILVHRIKLRIGVWAGTLAPVRCGRPVEFFAGRRAGGAGGETYLSDYGELLTLANRGARPPPSLDAPVPSEEMTRARMIKANASRRAVSLVSTPFRLAMAQMAP